MKFILGLVVVSNSLFGQVSKEKLTGNWVCVEILDSLGNPTSGKYGKSREYLRFTLSKSKLTISETPYDVGVTQAYLFSKRRGVIQIILSSIRDDATWNNLPSNIPELFYKIENLDDQQLTLSTKNENNQTIKYHFVRQEKFIRRNEKTICDNGLIVIKLSRLSMKYESIKNNIGEWIVSNDSIHLAPSPIFKAVGYFGDHVANGIKLPGDFPKSQLSNELIVEFAVNKKGAYNFIIKQSAAGAVDAEVLRVLSKLSKYWEPNNLAPNATHMRFHIYLMSSDGEFVLPFKRD